MENREEIRTKWIRHKPLMKLDECVDNAMQEYSDQQNKQLLEEIEELKRRVIYWNELHSEVIKDNSNLQSELKDKESVNEGLSKQIEQYSLRFRAANGFID